jgi:hypothetical protein
MKTEHGYSLQGITTALIAGVVVIILTAIERGSLHWWFYPFAIGFPLVPMLCFLSKVKINENEIRIDYFLPLKKNRLYTHEEIESYGAAKGKDEKGKASFGFLKPKNEENCILLSGLWTKNFPDLSDFLETLYPSNTETHNQSGDGQ